jgi:hypothetical protein
MRHVLLCLLLSGCTATSLTMPGKSPREATLATMRELLTSRPGIPQVYVDCAVSFMDKRLSDEEMKRIDAARATGGQDATWQALVPAAADACVK